MIMLQKGIIPKEFYNIKLSDKEIEDLKNGKLSELKNLNLGDSFIKGKLQLINDEAGNYYFKIHNQKDKLNIPEKIGNYKLKQDDIQALKNGEYIKPDKNFFMKVDQETNSVILKTHRDLKIPKRIAGYQLTDEDTLKLANGQELPPKVFHDKKTNQYFVAQYAQDFENSTIHFSNIYHISKEEAKNLSEELNKQPNPNYKHITEHTNLSQLKNNNEIIQNSNISDIIPDYTLLQNNNQKENIILSTESNNLPSKDNTIDVEATIISSKLESNSNTIPHSPHVPGKTIGTTLESSFPDKIEESIQNKDFGAISRIVNDRKNHQLNNDEIDLIANHKDLNSYDKKAFLQLGGIENPEKYIPKTEIEQDQSSILNDQSNNNEKDQNQGKNIDPGKGIEKAGNTMADGLSH